MQKTSLLSKNTVRCKRPRNGIFAPQTPGEPIKSVKNSVFGVLTFYCFQHFRCFAKEGRFAKKRARVEIQTLKFFSIILLRKWCFCARRFCALFWTPFYPEKPFTLGSKNVTFCGIFPREFAHFFGPPPLTFFWFFHRF